MQSTIIAFAATAALVAANKAPASDYYAQPAAVAVQPVTVVQNAAAAENTVTVTHTNGAMSNVLSLGSAFLAGTALLSYF
ncbi:hypothetical protein BX661DRAFT_188000 [Kickxella alabastrina]|uniref:Uncharacterized protein n=2 Tax=Kickxella alabastrina TaxID=61397 RepID=A0ACC1IEA0_9FUNG|nr:uncharacterized protein BX661DRAFT_188000 [Kickxella alabastrina]KAI7821811.1 hypothetical protein BX661DRAFT_188000 [Kickxella alabastrina]KAJ1893639.1 hypothetical protein LPJ66_005634 [Kickxella alabastrina]KAJ1893831.1 hypothetical protein LPJ66_005532 [Kickxella alabastrina]KAJ1947040.1 hypothetical protein GGF37_000724 [Kickxella alabastrina]